MERRLKSTLLNIRTCKSSQLLSTKIVYPFIYMRMYICTYVYVYVCMYVFDMCMHTYVCNPFGVHIRV